MKKKVIILGVCTLMVCGCGKTIPKLENGQEAVVTLNNGAMISVNDLYNDVKNNYALDALINMVDKKILEDKYKDSLESANQYAETTMKTLKETYGDELLSAIQMNTSYSTIEAYRNYVYLSHLQNLAVEDYAKEQVSAKDLKDYYDKNIFGDVLVNHILVTPKVSSTATAEEKTAAENEAKEKINTVIAKLKESSNALETFKELAKEYSDDSSTKNEGGSLGYVNNGTLSSNYDEIIKAALKLKNGEYSTEMITTELGYHVIYRENNKEKASYDDVLDSMKQTLSKDLMTKDTTMAVKAMQSIRKDYGMEIVDSEIQSQYAKFIQSALNAKQS